MRSGARRYSTRFSLTSLRYGIASTTSRAFRKQRKKRSMWAICSAVRWNLPSDSASGSVGAASVMEAGPSSSTALGRAGGRLGRPDSGQIEEELALEASPKLQPGAAGRTSGRGCSSQRAVALHSTLQWPSGAARCSRALHAGPLQRRAAGRATLQCCSGELQPVITADHYS